MRFLNRAAPYVASSVTHGCALQAFCNSFGYPPCHMSCRGAWRAAFFGWRYFARKGSLQLLALAC
jgi:hypothetical protein